MKESTSQSLRIMLHNLQLKLLLMKRVGNNPWKMIGEKTKPGSPAGIMFMKNKILS